MKPMLAQRVQQKVMAEVVDGLQKGAKIDLDKKFFPEPKGEPAPPAPAKPNS
jgi:hypothetical protein